MGLRVLITGASSGLGREMAIQLAREQTLLALTGRREEKLRETAELVKKAGGQVLILVGDASDPQTVKRHYAQIQEAWGGLDWAILNAGVSFRNPGTDFSAAIYRKTFETNIMGAVYWMETIIPDMVKARSGTIAGIASLAGFVGLPLSSAYSSSKAALISLLESLRLDLAGSGVSVVTVCPGFIKTEMTDKNDPKDMFFILEGKDGARRIIEAIRKKKRLSYFPWPLAWPMVWILPNLPRSLYDFIARQMIRRRLKNP
jgi:short-subunit dehydrogenase